MQGASNILVIYLGARLCIAGDMTVGMLFAFISYSQQFTDKTTSLIETGIKYRMLDLHLGRIADVALADREAGLDHEPLVSYSVTGLIELRDISFRYADTEPRGREPSKSGDRARRVRRDYGSVRRRQEDPPQDYAGVAAARCRRGSRRRYAARPGRRCHIPCSGRRPHAGRPSADRFD